MNKTTKPLTYNLSEGAMMLFSAKEKLLKLTRLLDAIIEANSQRYTHVLSLLNDRFKSFPEFMSLSETDELLDAMIDTTHELTNIIKNSNHANYFLDQHEMDLYSAFKLIETLERELNQFEKG